MNVLSLFDGMSCGQIALNRSGITVDNYYASELDTYAIKVTQANYPNTFQLGDVTKWRDWEIDWSSIDLLLGGSPCQGFSFAGKQLAFDDPRSKLFFVYVDILNHIKSVNPDVNYLLENVRMRKEYLAIISEHLGVEPVFINSALVSAQNRQRYYWCNWHIEQPNDKCILLKDIIDSECGSVNSAKDKNPEISGDYLHFDPAGKGHKSLCNRVNLPNSKHKSLSGTSGGNKHGVVVDEQEFTYRKLTPIECERLQTVDDGYTDHVSNTQRYKMLGNGWTVDVIAHLFKEIQ